MKEKMKLYLKWTARVFVYLVVLGVFAAFAGVFEGLGGKCIALGAFACFVLVLASKWGLVEWMQVHGCELVAKMASCQFCLSWWMTLLFGIVGFAACPTWLWLPAVFHGAVICWLVVRY